MKNSVSKSKQAVVLAAAAAFCLCALGGAFRLSQKNAYASQSFSLGTITNSVETTLDGGFTYKAYELNSGTNSQKIFYGGISVGEDAEFEMVLHNIYNSNGAFVTNTVLNIAKDYQNTTGRKVYAAVNGDFFSGGAPVESYAVDYAIKNIGTFAGKNSFGFDNNGGFALGKVPSSLSYGLRHIKDGKEKIIFFDKINAEPLAGEVALYTTVNSQIDFADTYKYTINIPVETVMGAKLIDATVSRVSSFDPAAELTLGQNKYAIVVKGQTELYQYLNESLANRDPITVFARATGDFDRMQYIVGGYERLVVDGRVTPLAELGQTETSRSKTEIADRTSIGITADGKLFFATIDGRQGATGYSKGANVFEMGQLMSELGAYNALELDGGGSTTFILRVGDTLTHVNQSSQGVGQMRPVANAVLIVEKQKPTEPDIDPDDNDDDDNDDDNDDNDNDNGNNGGNNGQSKDDLNIFGCPKGSVELATSVLIPAAAFVLFGIIKTKKQ